MHRQYLDTGILLRNLHGANSKRKLAVEENQRQEEAARYERAFPQAKQSQMMCWESVEKKKLSWREVWVGLDSCIL